MSNLICGLGMFIVLFIGIATCSPDTTTGEPVGMSTTQVHTTGHSP